MSEENKLKIDNIDVISDENKRLKEELDKEIKLNRILINALKQYANIYNWQGDIYEHPNRVWSGDEIAGYDLATHTLKQIGEK